MQTSIVASPRWRCACGLAHPATGESSETCSNRLMADAALHAILPNASKRRALIGSLGLSAVRAAIASVMPLSSLQAMAMESNPRALEKNTVKVGFVPLTCATPLLMAGSMGTFKEQGLKVELVNTSGWTTISEQVANGKVDASHFLSPMPIAASLGLDGPAQNIRVASIQNTNGQAITLSLIHKDRRDPKTWKGFRLAVPSKFSMHNFLLRYYLAENGLNPDTDVQILITPPGEMVSALQAGTIDGFLGPDPFNQRAVYEAAGFIHILSSEIWDGHPCCAFGVKDSFVKQNPNTFSALYRGVLNASVYVSVSADRTQIAKTICKQEFLNQPEEVVTQVLSGKFPDGLGNVRSVPDRVNFEPMPWPSLAVWMLTQMKRWGYVKGDVAMNDIANKVFMLTNARKQFIAAGWRDPDRAEKKIVVMGKVFDPTKPNEYLSSFAIRSMA